MPEIQPFPGIRYRVPDAELPKVLAPPYDVIPPAYQDELYARDPRNIVRVVLNRDAGRGGLRRGGRDLPALAGTRACWPRTTQPALLRARADLRRRRARRCTRLRAARALPRRGRRARAQVLPHEHTREAAEEDRYRVLQGHARQLQPHLPDVRRTRADASRRALAAATAARRRSRLHRRRRASRTGCGASPTRAAIAAFQQRARRARRPTSPTATTATRPRCATATRSARDGAWTLGYFTPLDVARPAGAAVPPHPGRGPVARRGARALCGAVPASNDARERGRGRARGRAVTMPYAFALAGPGGGALVAEALPEAEDLLPRTRRPACARSTPTSCTRSCCRGCSACPTTARAATCTRWRRPRRRWPHGALPAGRAAARHARAPDRGRGRGARVDARQEHVLPPEAAVGAGDPPAARVAAEAGGR